MAAKRVTLESPVTAVYGIGAAAKERLEKLEIYTVYDLITFLPRRYNDWSQVGKIADCREDGELSFYATVATTPNVNLRSRVKPLSFYVSDGIRRVKLMFFNSPYLMNKFVPGDKCFVHGKVSKFNGGLQLVNPYIEKADKVDDNELIKPVYHLTAGITTAQLTRWIKTALDLCAKDLQNCIPEDIVKANGFDSPEVCYRKVHFPSTLEEADKARRQIAYEELILLGVGMKLKKGNTTEEKAEVVIPGTALPEEVKETWKQIVSNLGFELTADQKKAIRQIQSDLMSSKPMNRLVQGDVGSGKTAVAILAMSMTALMGKQAVLLAPTSVLAKQHYNTAVNLLKDSPVNVALLLGKTPAAIKKELKEQMADGTASVIIGTHALLTDDVSFKDLALVIADEQHRFGVKQREKLLLQNNSDGTVNSVHNLVMTATPIPRTLAMVIYGDMDTTIIRQKPVGRKPIKTYFSSSKDDNSIFESIRAELKSGQQVYIVCAKISEDEYEVMDDDIVGEDDDTKITSVIEMKEILNKKKITKEYPAAVLYGSMPEKTKLAAMQQFLDGDIKILISTTVIEVGVDNPNANLMVVMDADRFGLSTLHQLRGRIGRGQNQAYCLLVSESKSETALSRMRMMCESTDGFELAQKDLELRGPGDFFGTRQHGIPTLRAANLYTDLGIAADATSAVNKVFEQGGEEAQRLEGAIKSMFELRFGGKMEVL